MAQQKAALASLMASLSKLKEDYEQFCNPGRSRGATASEPSVHRRVFDYLLDNVNSKRGFTAIEIRNELRKVGRAITTTQVTDALKKIRRNLKSPSWQHRNCRFGVSKNERYVLLFNPWESEIRGLWGRLSDPCEALSKPSLEAGLRKHLVIGDAILEKRLGGRFAGLSPEQIRVIMTESPIELLQPARVWQDSSDKPKSDRPKAYLAKWWYPQTDQVLDTDRVRLKNNEPEQLVLTIGNCQFWDTLSIKEARYDIYRLIEQGLDRNTLHRQLTFHVLVITQEREHERKLLLGKRGGEDAVGTIRPGEWGATLGEGMHGESDKVSGQFRPEETVRRALREELGLTDEQSKSASIRFVALLTEWDLLVACLVAVVKLPMNADDVKDAWDQLSRDNLEIDELDSVKFSVDECVPLVVTDRYHPEGAPKLDNVHYGTSRIAVLAALLSEFGEPARRTLDIASRTRSR